MTRADRQQLRTDHSAGQARRDRRPQRPRPRLQRRRRYDLRRSRPRSRIPIAVAAAGLRRARRAATRAAAPDDGRAAPRQAGSSPILAAPGVARRGASASARSSLKGIAFFKESRRYYPKKELAAHVLGYVGLDNVGLGGLESTYDQQIRGSEGQDAGPDRRAPAAMSTARSSGRPTAGATLELTIDQYLQYVAERELRARRRGEPRRRRHRRHHGSAAPARSWRWRTSRPSTPTTSAASDDDGAPQPRGPGHSTSPARPSRWSPPRRRSRKGVIKPDRPDRLQPRLDHVRQRGSIRDTHPLRPAVVHRRHRQVEQRRRDQGRHAPRAGAARPLRQPVRLRPGAGARLPRREPRHRLESVAPRRQRAGLGLDGLSGRRHAAADGHRGQLGRQRRRAHRAARRARRHHATAAATRSPHKVLRRTIYARHRRRADRRSWKQVVERGTGKRFATIAGYTVAGKTGTASKLVNGRYSKVDYNASFVGFVPSRNPAVDDIVVIDSPHAKGYYGGDGVAAPIFKRIAEATLRHLGVGPTINPPPPVLVAQHDSNPEAAAPHQVRAVPVAADRRSARWRRMPDLRGLSAREALRVLTRRGTDRTHDRQRLRRRAVAGRGHAARPRTTSACWRCGGSRCRPRPEAAAVTLGRPAPGARRARARARRRSAAGRPGGAPPRSPG